MLPLPFEILEKVKAAETDEAKIAIFKKNESHIPLRKYLQMQFDDTIKFLIDPDGVQFKQSDRPVGCTDTDLNYDWRHTQMLTNIQEYSVYSKRLREEIYLNLVESLCEGDVKFLHSIMKKTLDVDYGFKLKHVLEGYGENIWKYSSPVVPTV
jgi:hypothetical protein